MLQLFENEAPGLMARPGAVRSGLCSVMIHSTAILFLLSLGFSPVVQQLPNNITLVQLVAPGPPPPPPPPSAPRAAVVPVKRTVRVFTAKLTAPVAIPVSTSLGDMVADVPLDIAAVGALPGGVPGGIPGGLPTGVLGGMPTTELPPPPLPPPMVKEVKAEEPPDARPPQRILVASDVQEARMLTMVRPEYPRAARQAHIYGAVRLRAIIDCEGKIVDLRVLEGHVLLAVAARAAVEKWRYRPTFLNGEAVEVTTDIVVNFRSM